MTRNSGHGIQAKNRIYSYHCRILTSAMTGGVLHRTWSIWEIIQELKLLWNVFLVFIVQGLRGIICLCCFPCLYAMVMLLSMSVWVCVCLFVFGCVFVCVEERLAHLGSLREGGAGSAFCHAARSITKYSNSNIGNWYLSHQEVSYNQSGDFRK